MRNTIKILLLTLLLSLCDNAGAQNSELHVTVMFKMSSSESLFPLSDYDIQMSSEHFDYKEHLDHTMDHPGIFSDVPEGPLHISINFGYDFEARPFSDSIFVHKGLNAVMIELDSSGEHKITSKDIYGNPIPIPAEFLNMGIRADGTYISTRPARPKTGSIDGNRVLYSPVFSDLQGGAHPALELIEKQGWGRLFTNTEAPVKYGLMLFNNDVHWSWKNGAYVFWKD